MTPVPIACALLAAAIAPLGCTGTEPADRPDPLAAAGQRLYREGVGTSGQPVVARVMGDVPMSGAQNPCMACHGRSGMGASESGDRTPPIAAPLLFAPDARQRRPAYTDETLARALRAGVDAAGNPLDPLMPRYELGDDDVAALAAYLRTLGAAPSPGADDQTLRLATVIAGDVPADAKQEMLAVLDAFVAVHNTDVRKQRARAEARLRPGDRPEPYRTWTLEVWTLDGPPDRWGAQLDRHDREAPAFAMVSGLAAGPWDPVHDFCERRAVPCLLPDTDRPPERDRGFYTLYYSGGLRLEARIAAADLAAEGLATDVLQVVRSGDEAAAEAAASLAAAIGEAGGRARTVTLDPHGSPALDPSASAAVLWLQGPDLARLPPDLPPVAYLSATLLGGRPPLPEPLRERARIIDRLRDPGDRDPGLERFRAWARSRGLAPGDERLQAQTWYACVVLLDGVDHIGRYPLRDYLFDSLDHAAGLSAFLPLYPRGSFGPGQRRLAKGGQIFDPSGGPPRWIVP